MRRKSRGRHLLFRRSLRLRFSAYASRSSAAVPKQSRAVKNHSASSDASRAYTSSGPRRAAPRAARCGRAPLTARTGTMTRSLLEASQTRYLLALWMHATSHRPSHPPQDASAFAWNPSRRAIKPKPRPRLHPLPPVRRHPSFPSLCCSAP
jgi:hypothetical protein